MKGCKYRQKYHVRHICLHSNSYGELSSLLHRLYTFKHSTRLTACKCFNIFTPNFNNYNLYYRRCSKFSYELVR